MGNYMSCTFIAPPSLKSSRVARVIFPGGEIKQFREPVNAAELMLECPSHFLASSRSLQPGRRFSALAADEELELGEVYVMFPMRRVNSMVTAGDMTLIFLAASSSAPKRIAGAKKVRVSPESTGEEATAAAVESPQAEDETRPRLEEVEGFPLAEYRHRLAVCRSRRPLLETIKEEAVLSR